MAVVAVATTTHLGLWTIQQSEAFSTVEQSRQNRHSSPFDTFRPLVVLGSRNDQSEVENIDGLAETDDRLTSSQRRDFCTKSIATILGCLTTTTTAVPSLSQKQHSQMVEVANAACLPGDLSKDCIGVYKLPYLDATQSSWLYDKDTLREFAPDIRYIEVEKQPKTLKEAVGQLVTERKKVKLIKDVVLEGDLEQAGTIILNLIPKVTSAGLKIQQDLYDRDDDEPNVASGPAAAAASNAATNAMNEIKRRKFDNSLQIVIAEWSSIDIAIGQAIRGQRGVTAVAQIEILSYLKDATVALDDFIALINEERETA